jgi:hypothetical protein
MPGMTILHYEFLEKIGAGGMGEVFKAQDKRLNRFVAIKALPYARSGDPERRRRFTQEAQTASSLSHPNIVTIHDIFQEGDTHFIVMEYVAGRTLLDLIPPAGMPAGQMLLYAAQMASALNAAHQAGIIHRDFKPANVMVTSSGLVKVLDFGLAKLMQPQSGWMGAGSENSETMLLADQLTHSGGPQTAEGSILGTVNYMSPEQAEGKRVDGRSDIFSLGAVMYEMLTGRRAFHGNSDIATLSAVLRDEVAPVSAVVPGVPPEVEDFINVCLRKDPAARWQTMQEVETGLAALQRRWDSGTLSARHAAAVLEPLPKSAPAVAAPAKSVGLKKILIVGAACVLLLVAAGAAWWLSRRPHATGQVAQAPAASSQVATIPAAPSPDQPVSPDAAAPAASAPSAPAPAPAVPSSLPAASVPTPPVASKKDASALPQAPQAAAPVVSTAQPVQPVAALPAPAPKPTKSEIARSLAQPVTVTLGDGVPFRIALAQDITVLAQEHEQLTFRAAEDVKAGDTVVIAKGAIVTGEVVNGNGKKFLGIGSKMTFKLNSAEGVDGQKIPVRASATRRPDGPTVRPVDSGKYSKPKELAAVSGAEYIAYIDGDQSITLRK